MSLDHRAASRPGFQYEGPAEDLDPFTHSRHAQTVAAGAGASKVESRTGVGDLDYHMLRFASHPHPLPLTRGMAQAVVEGFLDDAVERDLRRLRERVGNITELELDRKLRLPFVFADGLPDRVDK